MEKKVEFNIVFAPVIGDYIGKALETLYKYTDPELFRVIVVDQTIRGVYEEVKDKTHIYVRPHRHLGFAQGMNTGWRLSTAPFTILSNDDIEFINSAWWSDAKKVFDRMPEAMAINPMSVAEAGWGYALGKPYFKCPDWGVVDGDLIIPKLPDGTGLGYKEKYTDEDYQWLKDFRRGHIEGIAMWMPIIKKEAVEKIGYIDERFYPGGGEDYDWVARCYSAGYRAIASCDVWVWHHWSKSIQAKDKLPPLARTPFNNVDELWEIDETKERNPIYHSPPRRRKSTEVVAVDY